MDWSFLKDALKLIRNQKLAIKELQSENDELHETLNAFGGCLQYAEEFKDKAIKEFAERLKTQSFVDDLSFDGKETVYVSDIDNLVKEMEEKRMNREILFRGKRADNGEWIEGYYFEEMGSFIK